MIILYDNMWYPAIVSVKVQQWNEMDFIEELSIIQIAFACMPSHFLPIMPKYVFWPYLSIQIYVCNLGSIWICFITQYPGSSV